MTPVRSDAVIVEGVLGEKVRQLEERAEKWDARLEEQGAAIARIDRGVARIEGSLDGAFRSKKLSGALLGVIVSVGASAILGLLLFALKGG